MKATHSPIMASIPGKPQ